MGAASLPRFRMRSDADYAKLLQDGDPVRNRWLQIMDKVAEVWIVYVESFVCNVIVRGCNNGRFIHKREGDEESN